MRLKEFAASVRDVVVKLSRYCIVAVTRLVRLISTEHSRIICAHIWYMFWIFACIVVGLTVVGIWAFS